MYVFHMQSVCVGQQKTFVGRLLSIRLRFRLNNKNRTMHIISLTIFESTFDLFVFHQLFPVVVQSFLSCGIHRWSTTGSRRSYCGSRHLLYDSTVTMVSILRMDQWLKFILKSNFISYVAHAGYNLQFIFWKGLISNIMKVSLTVKSIDQLLLYNLSTVMCRWCAWGQERRFTKQICICTLGISSCIIFLCCICVSF